MIKQVAENMQKKTGKSRRNFLQHNLPNVIVHWTLFSFEHNYRKYCPILIIIFHCGRQKLTMTKCTIKLCIHYICSQNEFMYYIHNGRCIRTLKSAVQGKSKKIECVVFGALVVTFVFIIKIYICADDDVSWILVLCIQGAPKNNQM